MDFECPICIDNVYALYSDENQLCMVSDCGHVFHRKCVTEWQKRGRNTCPICQQRYQKVYNLFGLLTRSQANSVARTPPPVGSSNNDIDAYLTIHFLRDEVSSLQNKVTEANAERRQRDRRSDQKDLEIMRLNSEKQRLTDQMKKFQEHIEELETKLAMTESLIS
ncbi:E3 ubiquitin-protein ligase TRAIP [Folsomia candida]|nr:E3 ubiquitin-protein ligase TRAIP [Folsomia candida]